MADIPDYVTGKKTPDKTGKKPLLRSSYAQRLRELPEEYDSEPGGVHRAADEILLEVLSDLQYEGLVSAYKKLREDVGFWYE